MSTAPVHSMFIFVVAETYRDAVGTSVYRCIVAVVVANAVLEHRQMLGRYAAVSHGNMSSGSVDIVSTASVDMKQPITSSRHLQPNLALITNHHK